MVFASLIGLDEEAHVAQICAHLLNLGVPGSKNEGLSMQPNYVMLFLHLPGHCNLRDRADQMPCRGATQYKFAASAAVFPIGQPRSGRTGRTSRQHDIAIQVFSDIHIALHDGVEASLINAGRLHAHQTWCEENLRAPESFAADCDDLPQTSCSSIS